MKVLAIPNAHALAHVSRLLEIAKVLRQAGHSVLFAGHGKYLQVAAADGFATRELPYIPEQRLVEVSRSQRLWEWFEETELEGFIEAELGLYDEWQPDLVLLDNRATARTSAEKAGLKTVAVLNVHMSNQRRVPFFSVGNLLNSDNFPGVRQLDRLENASEVLLWDQLVMRPLNRVRRKLGLKRLYGYQHEQGDLSLLADIPQFNPVSRLPPMTRFVGPLTWHNDLPAPACLEQLRADRPTVYLALGSTSLEDLLGEQLHELSQGMQLVVATGAAIEPGRQSPEGVFLEQYVNTDQLLPHCDLVCCHGGNGTLYQALSHGLPAVVVATHQEQNYGGKRIQQLGLGRAFTDKTVKQKGLQPVLEAVREVLDDPRYRANARGFSRNLEGWHPAERAVREIEHFMNKH